MKHPYFKTILLCLCMFASINAFAEAVEIDGIYYNLITKIKQAEVTYNPNTYKGRINIPEIVHHNGVTFSVTRIGNGAFDHCKRLSSVTIPNSVTSIGDSAFYYCSDLSSIIIPNSVTNIGRCAFYYCTGLTSITIPNSVIRIGEYAFIGCSGLTSITIGNSVTSIGSFAFNGCSGLTSINVEAGNTTYDSRDNCNALIETATNTLIKGCENTTIPNSVTSIGSYAFEDCSGLTSVTIPNSVTAIYSDAFRNCSGLTSITIPNSVTIIYDSVFYGCSGLTSVTIPNSVTAIYGYTFYGCYSLTSVTIPNSVTEIFESTFYGCSGLTSVIIPNSVTSIRAAAFLGCSGLTSVTIPNSVTSIEESAFNKCTGLISVNIGNGVESIGYGAFANCAELTDVYCYAENVPFTESNPFSGSYIEYATLHVPAASVEQYKATAPWSNFGAIVATDGTIPEPPTPEKCATPTISYSKGELTFSCDTEGAEYVYEITDTDIKKGCAAKVSLTVTYNISVYATKTNYENSDTIQATLCWIEQQPQTEGITDEDAIAEVQAVPVLIQTQGNTITVEGAEAGTEIILYGANGVQLDSVIATTGIASLNTSRLSGSVAIVKIGNKTVKVLVKQ